MVVEKDVHLEPCPFCGSKEENPYDHTSECYLHMLWSLIEGISEPSRGDLMKAWNTRAERTCEVMYDEHGCPRCGECGYVLYSTSGYCPTCGVKVVE